MKLGLVQQANSSDRAANIEKLKQNIRACALQGAELVVLQELHNGLYFCQTENTEVFDQAEPIPGPSTEGFGALAKELGIVLVLSLFEKRAPGLYHNTAVVIEKDGAIAGKYRKMHIPDDPAYYEKFYFTPGDLGFEPIGWESSDTEEEKKRQLGAWVAVQRGHAVANGLPVVTVNRVGHEADPSRQTNGIQFWGNSFVAGPQGELLAELSNNDEEIRIVEIDKTRSENVRRWWPFFRDRRIDAFGGLTERFLI